MTTARALGLDASVPSVTENSPPEKPPPPPRGAPRRPGASPAPGPQAKPSQLYPAAAQDERVLLDLVAGEMELLAELRGLECRLVGAVAERLHDAKTALAFSDVLRQVVTVDAAISRKVREALLTASTLRARRGFLEKGGANEV